uniref:Uncharacterized protein n=1 Tax=Arundo donax TaxID=35708 RepID=A0A0A9A5L0_ARUDO
MGAMDHDTNLANLNVIWNETYLIQKVS